VTKDTLIRALAGTQPKPKMVVADQSVQDIIQRMMIKHVTCMPDYDKIYQYFDEGDLMDTCYKLWKFCRDNFTYVVEDEDRQNVSSPLTMLKGMKVDCKNYSLFIAGNLDAMKRHGKKLTWEYRYASYELFHDVGHVFVVVNPNTDNIWVDPVLDEFNWHLFYWHKIDKKPKLKAVAGIPIQARGGRIGNAVDDLAAKTKEYTDGIVAAVQATQQTSTLNSVSSLVLSSASMAIPGAGEAMALLKSGAILVSDLFGVGSAAARVLSDLASFNVTGLFNDLFNGRTYQYQHYWLAALYNFYVLGRNITNQNQMTDTDVWPARKWFIDRTGVYIDGTELLQALTISVDKYLGYYNVNKNITTDRTRVAAAVAVAQQWKNAPINPGDASGNWVAQNRGSWANTVGVFDQQLINIANMTGQSVEQVAAQGGNQYASDYLNQTTSSNQIIPGIDNSTLIIAGGALLVGFALLD
jgi:hypothetical protein